MKMTKHSKCIQRSLVFSCLIFLSFFHHAQANFLDLGQAGGFNAFILGDMTGYGSDVEGRLAVGGNLKLNHFSVAMELSSAWDQQDTLVVGGNLEYTNGRVYHGNARIGGTVSINETVGFYSGENPAQTNGSLINNNDVDFDALSQQIINKSQNWANFAANGNVNLEYSQLTLTGENSGLNIFSITSDHLASTQKFTLNIPTDAWALINVSGTSVTMNNFGFFRTINGETNQLQDNAPPVRHDGSLTQKVLFNLTDATSLLLHSIGIKGSLLAPLADTVFYNGHIDGNLLVGSLQGKEGEYTGQVNLYPLTPGSQNTSPVPIPGMLPILTFAISSLLLLRRRKNMIG
ncbi:choice-of-anchor A family protein [Methylicorpusculum sp.]|uniref:choice-of-anchor A family protein n=1 Tax=Methylicorpusculum sp. TaxID=2713644 RepID=UPI0027286F5E|nr:choice-of-anchor A family protein [Methylicorpusculum sp.]MDO8845183.1 choice-of-anchor A family protein [Methylicorpusculum sp.]